MKALLLSAGLGTRLKPITDKIPKVMVPINGKPCIQHHIENLSKQGIREFAINTHSFPDAIKSYVGDGSRFGVSIRYSYEKSPLGTAGALNNFRNFFTEPFYVVYADVFANFSTGEMDDIQRRNGSDITITLDGERDKLGKGVVLLNGEKVRKFVEKPSEEIPGSLINSGFYLVQPKVLQILGDGFSDFGKDILPQLASEGKVSACQHEGYIFDIGTIEDLNSAEEFLRKHP